MKINIKVTGVELTSAISDYVHKKISSIEKYFENNNLDAVAHVEVGKTTNHHRGGDIYRAEVHIIGAGLDLYAVSEKDDLYAAIDLVKDEIVRSIVHSKDKKETLTRRGAEVMKNMMKGLYEGTRKGVSWSMGRIRFKNSDKNK